jgi:hypothetical protein
MYILHDAPRKATSYDAPCLVARASLQYDNRSRPLVCARAGETESHTMKSGKRRGVRMMAIPVDDFKKTCEEASHFSTAPRISSRSALPVKFALPACSRRQATRRPAPTTTPASPHSARATPVLLSALVPFPRRHKFARPCTPSRTPRLVLMIDVFRAVAARAVTRSSDTTQPRISMRWRCFPAWPGSHGHAKPSHSSRYD